MAVERAFSVKFFGDARQLINSFNKVQKEAASTFGKGGLGGKLSSLLPSFKTLAVAGTAAFGAISAAAGLAARAAAQDEESQRLLKQALDNTFGATQQLTAGTEAFVKEMMLATATSDDELRPALGLLVRATGDLSKAQDLLKLSLDIAAGSGRDLSSVSVALARAANGSFTALTRLGVPISESAVKSKNLTQITKELTAAFDGSAEAAANTSAGNFRKFGIAVEELQEQFGALLLPALVRVTKYLTDTVIPAVSLAVDAFQSRGVKDALAFFVAAFGNAGIAVLNQLEAVSLGIYKFMEGVVATLSPLFVAIDLVRSALAFGKPIDSIQKQIQDRTKAVAGAFDGFRSSVERASRVLNAEANPAIVNANSKLETFGSKTQAAKKDLSGLGDETEKTAGKVGKLTDKLSKTDKIQKYTNVLKDAKRASDAFGSSQERVGETRESLAEADQSLAEAQEALRKAQAGGTPAEVADAQRKLAAAERSRARAGFDIEQAVIAVRQAEADLAKLRSDPESTPDAIRVAEIALAEAKFAVADSEDRQIEVTNELAEARRNLRIATDGLRVGDEELIPFQTEVERLTKAQEIASKNYTKALEDETEAVNNYADALKNLKAVQDSFPKVAKKQGGLDGLRNLPSQPPTPQPTYGGYGSGDTTLNMYVTGGMGVDGPMLGQDILEALRDYERVYGPLNFAL